MAGEGVVSQFFGILFNPSRFYSTMPKQGGMGEPIRFYLIFSSIGLLINILGTSLMFGNPALKDVPLLFFSIEAGIFIAGFIAAFLLHLVWKVLGSEESYETSYRAFAYTAAISPVTSVVAFVPTVGIVLAMAWVFVLLIIASSRVHAIKQPLAVAVWGVVGVLMIMLTLSYELGYRGAVSLISKASHTSVAQRR